MAIKHCIRITYSLEVVLEVFEWIASGDLGWKHLHLVHVSHDGDGGPTTDTAAARQEQGAAGLGEDAVDARHVVQNLVEHQDIKVSVLALCTQ